MTPEAGISVVKKVDFGESWNPGVRIGVGVGYDLNTKWSVNSGLYYTTRGYKLGQDFSEFIGMTELTRNFIQLPLGLNHSILLNQTVKLNLGLGPYVALSIKDNKTGGQLVGSKMNLFDDMSKFDWGIHAKVGVEINNLWQINLNFSSSIAEETKNDGIGLDYYTINLSAGYKFSLSK